MRKDGRDVLPYWAVYFIACFGALGSNANFDRRRVHFGLIAYMILLVGFIGLRFKVGADWENYIYMFQSVGDRSLASAIQTGDVGYVYLNWLGNVLGLDIWFVNLVCAAVFCLGLYRLSLFHLNPWTTVAIAVPYVVIAVAMGYTRQGAALGMIMFAIADYVAHRNLVRLTVFIFIASLFHSSAVIVLPFIAFAGNKSSVTYIIVAICAAVFIYSAITTSDAITRVQDVYLHPKYSSQGATVRVLMSVASATLFFLFNKRMEFDPVERSIWRNFSLAAFAALAGLYLVESSTLVDRLAIFLMPLQIVVFAKISTFGGRKISSLVFVLAVYGAVLFTWLNFAANVFTWLPYRNYLFE